MSPTNGFFGLPIGIKMFAVAGNCESGPEPAGASLQNNFIQMVLEPLESDASEAVFQLALSPGPMPISRHLSFFFFFFRTVGSTSPHNLVPSPLQLVQLIF